ncbi:MAG: ExeM/NucH family extracellular endonuclease, partial [Leptolyngbyaceae cyanobacterium SL_7_1]|nr:ExeM/NucH family extracellular endonuclease [Leptolyngbyaceae cyanobacterium SL_7_1]
MLVTFPETLSVTETFNLGRFGEVLLSSEGRLFNPTNAIDPTDIPSTETENDENNVAAVTAQQTANNRNQILLDDASNTQNPVVVPFLHPDGVNEGTLRIGDTVEDLTGVLGFGFGSYRIQPTITPDFQPTNPRTAAPDEVGGNVKVASFNVLNYFTTIDNGSNDARGADSAVEFERQQAKIVSAITAIDADVLGLIEIENNGLVAISNLVDALNAEAGAGTYAVVADPANYAAVPGGDDAIKVAFIYKPGSVSLVGEAQTIDSPAFNIGRAPVAQTFSLNSNGATFTAIINHFKSKSAGGETGLDTDQGDGQGAFNATRIQQAEALLTFINSLKTSTGDDDVLVIGDLNAYGEEDPIDVLRNGGLVDELGRFETDPYSFVFQGQSGRLDHALTTAALSAQVSGVTEWHINADEPRILDYNTEFNQPSLYDESPYRSSDHDPVIVGLNLAAPNQAPIATDDSATVTVGQSVTISVVDNDSDPDGDAFSVTSFTTPTTGSVVDNGDGSFTYTASLNGAGIDSFTYTITDANGDIDTATVNLTIDRRLIQGTNRADSLVGSIADERIIGGGSSDVINGNGGNDELLGEDGNDSLSGGTGNDLIDGATGNDIINGNGGYDTLIGGSGNDRIVGGAQDDLIFGDAGNDTITAGGSDGGGTSTEITSRGGGDVIFTGRGNDVVNLGTGKATVVLEEDSGFDTINNFQLG